MVGVWQSSANVRSTCPARFNGAGESGIGGATVGNSDNESGCKLVVHTCRGWLNPMSRNICAIGDLELLVKN